jgi:hypothetical protein
MNTLLDYLNKVKDSRRSQGKQYQLGYIILFSIFAALSGFTGNKDTARFIEERFELLTDKFRLKWIRPPAASTIGYILRSVDKESLEEHHRKYTEEVLTNKPCKYLAIDGKVLRGSYDHMDDKKALNILNMFALDERLVIAHYETSDKSNEIPAMQEFIKEIGLSDKVFTMDAMHCQKKLCK